MRRLRQRPLALLGLALALLGGLLSSDLSMALGALPAVWALFQLEIATAIVWIAPAVVHTEQTAALLARLTPRPPPPLD